VYDDKICIDVIFYNGSLSKSGSTNPETSNLAHYRNPNPNRNLKYYLTQTPFLNLIPNVIPIPSLIPKPNS